MTEPKRTSTSPAPRPAGAAGAAGSKRRPSTSPTGTRRAGRREVPRHRYEEPSLLQRFRTPILVIGVVLVVVAVSAFVFMSAAAATYSCGSIDTVKPAVPGELGQVQADMGNTHVARGDQVKYPVCPPASGKHVNNPPYGPIPPKVYAPDSGVVPNGWVHNLEHGGLVLLYSCDKGACDDASLQQLQAFYDGFPSSPVCGLAPGTIGPVIAPFEQMPTRYAALVWDRVLYLDELDVNQIYEFFTRYAERVDSEGNVLAPPEPQCNPPSPSPSAGESQSAGPSPSAAASPSAVASPSPAASPAVEPQPSPSPS